MAEPGYLPKDRRPIPARDQGWSRRCAAALAGRGVTANQISIAGMFLGLMAGICLAATTMPFAQAALRTLWVLAALLIFGRLLANMFDGMVAVATGTASPVGELYNEVPDRISDSAILIGAGYALGGWPVMGWCAALAAMFTAYARAVGRCAGAPSEFCGPMAKQQRMFLMIFVALLNAALPGAGSATYPLPAGGTVGAAGLALAVIAPLSLITVVPRLGRSARRLRTPGGGAR